MTVRENVFLVSINRIACFTPLQIRIAFYDAVFLSEEVLFCVSGSRVE